MISFVLNGKRVETESSPTARLLDVLREEFSLSGAKEGCGEGECGACSILLDGKLVNSCLIAIGSIEGKDVMTIEGFSGTERFKVLSDAFAEVGAVQCGFCIPGMVLASECLLSSCPTPTEEEIRIALSGNLCRCTGYELIVKAVQLASERGAGTVWPSR